MKNLAIIPARGGSKRIPRKNIKEFLGRPIIAYSIETALKSELFDEVMVSTDDEEIAEVAREYGAEVPFMRSDENADDYATTVEVLLEVLEEYEKRDYDFDQVCCLYPTAPFVTEEDLKKGLKLLEKATSSLPVVEFEFPIQRAFKKNKNNIRFAWPKHEKTRSQDLEAFYHDAGQWYWITAEALRKEKKLLTRNTKTIEKKRLFVQDIDTEEDWHLAELKYNSMK